MHILEGSANHADLNAGGKSCLHLTATDFFFKFMVTDQSIIVQTAIGIRKRPELFESGMTAIQSTRTYNNRYSSKKKKCGTC